MNRCAAVFKKQLKDTLKNKMLLLQFVLFPLLAFLFTEFIAKASPELPDTYFTSLFATMYAGMVPLINMANIISEEREKKSLQMLIMSNVKPLEYLVGVGGYVLILCTLGGVAFGLISGYGGADLVKFVLVMMFGTISSILLGSAVGILSKNQGSATALAMPFAMVTAFMPMIAIFNEGFAAVSKYLYTQQINYLINDLSNVNFTLERILIIAANIIIFILIFAFAYTKADLKE